MGKTVPNQKVVKIQKEACNKENLYAAINLQAMENAALTLDAGAFKLWCYFAKNQNNYSFALSSKAVETSFGMKIKQYNNAIDELIEHGFLVNTNGNNYFFIENPVMTKGNNDVMPKGNNELCPNVIRNNTDNTYINNTETKSQKEKEVFIF